MPLETSFTNQLIKVSIYIPMPHWINTALTRLSSWLCAGTVSLGEIKVAECHLF